MAEDTGDKTEAPTARRREEAREQGNIARSTDLTAAVLLLATLLLLNASGPNLVAALKALVGRMLSAQSLSNFSAAGAMHDFVQALEQVGLAMAPLLAGVMVVAIVANIAQVGFILNAKRLAPNLEALNPIRGVGKVFGPRIKPTQMLLSVAKLVIVALVAYSAIHTRIVQIVSAQRLSFGQLFLLGAQTIYAIAFRAGIALLFIAIIEYAYHRWRIEQDLKMTKQEVKDEMRRMDGDPKIKQRRRQIAIQRHQQKLKKDVPTADVIVTNPTHFAIALKYDAGSMHSPRVIAKGQDLMALRIREIAIEHGVPILERAPLARALYKMVKVGQEIPEQFYSAVAEILAYVYELSGKPRQRQPA
ncbi:MAG TPA: flagellar biosynthesis protein FlhB [Tepidisphaeraceae bacterium]|nr:flagellar biosynthesis protein FlhB [Tepidisphaeraceae bacterium]